jgi:organic hydroperoxide reductase OsmC/OhrA
MIESHDYQVQLNGTGPKTGILDSIEDGLPSLGVASPPQFGGPGRVWSPEHLFVASAAACLMTTFQAIAAMSNLDLVDYGDDATGHLIRGEDRRYRIERVTLRPRVVVGDPDDVEKAQGLLETAKTLCLISRSMSCDIDMEPTVEAAASVSAGRELLEGAHTVLI